MPSAISTVNTASLHATVFSRATQTEAPIAPDNSTLGKIASVLGKIKNNAIQPGLAMLGTGIRKVNQWCHAHPTAALIFGTALAITSIVVMATGGPAGVFFGGLGLGAGAYLAAKSLPAALRKLKKTAPAQTAPVAVRTAFTQTPGPLAQGAANLATTSGVSAYSQTASNRADASSSRNIRKDGTASVRLHDTPPRKPKFD